MRLNVGKGVAAFHQALAERALEGEGMALLDKVTPDDVYRLIKEDASLVGRVPDAWQRRVRKMSGALYEWSRIVLTEEYLTNQLRERKPELLGIIMNTPGGEEWLMRQISDARKAFLT